MKRVILLLLISLSTCWSVAQVRLASVFTDNMVIEQSTLAPIWGTAPASSKVRIIASWAPKDTVQVVVEPNGHWRAYLQTPAADMVAHTIKCNNVEIKNVMLGEVWLCSGQSNMEWNVPRGILNGKEEMAAANYPNIRFFQVPLVGASTPQNHVDASWTQCTPQTMRTVSSVGYFFGRTLHRELNNIPIGIISSAWGGANAEAWAPSEVVNSNTVLSANRVKTKSTYRPIEPGSMYNQMINPIVPFALAGVIWYQGESNRENASTYNELMSSLISSWRTNFKRTKLPFYFVQIAPFNYNENNLSASVVREQQEETANRMPQTGMVVVMDKVDDVNNIHPKDKTVVGERLAAFALAEVYKKPITDYKSPTYKSVEFSKGRAIVTLKNATAGLTIAGKKAIGMKIAGQDGVLHQAEVKIVRDSLLEVWSRDVKTPRSVRYCFDDTTRGNIMTKKGLPVAPFRSDAPKAESNYGKQIYAKSYLNQKAPNIIVEEWLTEQPDTVGKFILLDFWATWCGPCRASIPDLNEFQKKFKDNLVVIGLSDEKPDKINSMTEPKIEYTSATDTEARTKKEMKVSGIPHAILIDPQGIVRWEGFPLLYGHKLTEQIIKELIEKYK